VDDVQQAAPIDSAVPSAIQGYFADPHLVVFDDRYYLYPTTDGSAGWSADSFEAFSSSDLDTWQPHGEIFSVPRDTGWAVGHAWAPAVARHGDRYFLYYTADGNIGVAVAASPIGPFEDVGHPLVAAGDFEGAAIDPSVFVDNDGTAYLLWGNDVAHIVPLAADLVSFDRVSVVSWRPTAFREAAWMHRRGATYYLSWSENDTREADYRVRYATSANPLGPWTDRGVLLQKRPEIGVLATGHHSVAHVPGSDEWLIAYHRFAIPDGNGYRREVVIDRLHHESDGLLRPVRPAAGPHLLRLPLPISPPSPIER
jgi:beta-xylosidase